MADDGPGVDEAPVSMLDPSIAACPHAAYRQLREFKQGVSRMPLMKIPMITRYEDVVRALRDTETFSSEMSEELQLGNERPMIPQQIDPPVQSRYRRLLDPLFSRRRSLRLEPEVRRQANALIDAFIDEDECEFNSSFAIPLPCSVFLSLFGLPYEDLDLFLEMKDGIIRPHAKTQDLEEMVRIRKDAGSSINEYFEKEIDSREGQPRGDDLLDDFLSFELDGEKLTRNGILDICFLTLIAGLDTVTATLGCDIAFLAANPDTRRKGGRCRGAVITLGDHPRCWTKLELIEWVDPPPEAREPGAPHALGVSRIALRCKQLHPLVKRLEAEGIVFETPPQETDIVGAKGFALFRDPDGVLLELIEL